MKRRPAFVPRPDWPTMDGQPRAPLGDWPTPVQKMENASRALGTDVWVKREDLCGAWGGNKVRKLEFWLARPEVWKSRRLIVSGAGGSTWTAAAALHARDLGLGVVAALAGEIPEERRRLYANLGVDLVHHPNLNALPFVVAKARLTAPKAVRLPMGGSGWPGDLGSLLCGVEIVEGIEKEIGTAPHSIFVAAGTGGTAAGIAAELALRRDLAWRLVAVRVTPRPLGTAALVRRRAKKLIRKLQMTELTGPPPIVGENRFFGNGYGKPGPGVDEAIEVAARDGLELERTYTAKAFAALIAHAREGAEGPLLFVHTATSASPS